MAEQSAAIKIADTKKKITRTINRKFSKTQPIVKPGMFDDGGGLDAYRIGVGRFIWAIVGVVFIIPISVIAGMLGGVSRGLQDGIDLVSDVYKTHLGL